jgi:helix-turn-helix protein
MQTGGTNDPEYVARLIESTKVARPKRVEIHFNNHISLLIVEGNGITSGIESPPVKTKVVESAQTRNLIEWLSQYRVNHSISIQKLADQTQISAGSLKAYFNGKRSPGEIILGKIQKFKDSRE